MVASCLLKRSLVLSAAFTLIAAASEAQVDGPNARAEITLGNGEQRRPVKNPEVGDIVVLSIRLAGTSQLKGGLARVKYDAEFVEFVGSTPGDHPSTVNAFGDVVPPDWFVTAAVLDPSDGLTSNDGGGTLLGAEAVDNSGSGLFARFAFRVIKEPGDEVVRISVIQVRLNRTAEVFNVRNFRVGDFGLELSQEFPNSIFDVQIQARDRYAVVEWKTRLPGFNDVVTVEKVDDGNNVVENLGDFDNPLRGRVPALAFDVLRQLEAQDIDILEVDDAKIRESTDPPLPVELPANDPIKPQLAAARVAVKLLRERKHVVPIGRAGTRHALQAQHAIDRARGPKQRTREETVQNTPGTRLAAAAGPQPGHTARPQIHRGAIRDEPACRDELHRDEGERLRSRLVGPGERGWRHRDGFQDRAGPATGHSVRSLSLSRHDGGHSTRAVGRFFHPRAPQEHHHATAE